MRLGSLGIHDVYENLALGKDRRVCLSVCVSVCLSVCMSVGLYVGLHA